MRFYCLIYPKTPINNRSLTKAIVHKSVVFFRDFSLRNFSALLTNLHVNIIQAEPASSAVTEKEQRMMKLRE